MPLAIGLFFDLTGSGGATEPEAVAPSIVEVVITPTFGTVGETFTALITATGYPVPTFTYQWELDGTPISGAESINYTAEDAGDLTVVVTATNTEGSDGPTESAAVTVGASIAGDALLLEDGTSFFTLEDGTSKFLMEAA